jgi:hypothetical protein
MRPGELRELIRVAQKALEVTEAYQARVAAGIRASEDVGS